MHHLIWSSIVVLAIVTIIFCGSFFLGIDSWELSTGIVIGFLTSATASLLLSLDQFRASTAGYRVEKTIEATNEILKSMNRSRVRDRYRYSLGVIIDKLEKTFGTNNAFEKVEWPCLIDYDCKLLQPIKGKDRWDLFNRYVRPVIEDINGSSFIDKYYLARCFPRLRQLSALTKLCKCLENVVCELDAAFEANRLIELIQVNGDAVIRPTADSINSESKSIERLRDKYHDLHTAWHEWLRITYRV